MTMRVEWHGHGGMPRPHGSMNIREQGSLTDVAELDEDTHDAWKLDGTVFERHGMTMRGAHTLR